MKISEQYDVYPTKEYVTETTTDATFLLRISYFLPLFHLLLLLLFLQFPYITIPTFLIYF